MGRVQAKQDSSGAAEPRSSPSQGRGVCGMQGCVWTDLSSTHMQGQRSHILLDNAGADPRRDTEQAGRVHAQSPMGPPACWDARCGGRHWLSRLLCCPRPTGALLPTPSLSASQHAGTHSQDLMLPCRHGVTQSIHKQGLSEHQPHASIGGAGRSVCSSSEGQGEMNE